MPPITRNQYGDFKYGEGFYGIDIQPTGPKAVTNLFVIREPFYNIIHWDAPAYNVDGSPCTPARYSIFRTEKTNLQNITLIKDLTTLDFTGKVDTCWIDQLVGSDQAKDFFYQIVCVNDQLVAGVPSEFEGDIYTAKDPSYNETNVYTMNKNNAFYKILEDIPSAGFIDTEANVVPYVLNNGHLFIEFFPLIAPGTILSLYVNSTLQGKNYNRDFFYFWIPAASPSLPYSSDVTVSVANSAGTVTYKTYNYKTYNYLTFIDSLARIVTDAKIDVKTVNNDLYVDEIRLGRIYDIFGFPFEFNKPRYLTDVEYKAVVLGNTDKPGLMSSFLNYGGTYRGIKDVIKSVVGKQPKIETYKDVKGMIARTGMPLVDGGTATAGGGSTLTDATKTWTTDEFARCIVKVTSGTGIGQTRRIVSNNATQLTITPAWVTPPAGGSTYRIFDATGSKYILEAEFENGLASAGGASTLTDSTKTWYTNIHKGKIILLTEGTGASQYKYVTANTGTIITVDTPWDIVPDNTTQYLIFAEGAHKSRLFSIAFKAFALKVTVYDGVKSVAGEQITTTADVDYLDGTHILGGVAIVDSVGHTYVQTIDYDVDPDLGIVVWLPGGISPAVGVSIYCSYQFVMRDAVSQLANLVKQAQYNLLFYFYLLPYGFGSAPFALYPFGAP